jgi:dTMP kinase
VAGRFVTFEGGEGTGKSTQARALGERLRAAGHEVVLTREPGGTPGAEEIRALLVSGATDRWTAWTEACLVNAARADHVERLIRPALARGAWVICDRYIHSTLAYQGAGKGLATEALKTLHRLATDDLWPDLTLVLTLPPEQGLSRAASRAGGEARFEALGEGFHERVAAAFAAMIDGDRVVGIDAGGSVAEVSARIDVALARLA